MLACRRITDLTCCTLSAAAATSPCSRSISPRNSCGAHWSRLTGSSVSGSISSAASTVRAWASSAAAALPTARPGYISLVVADLAGGLQAAQPGLGCVVEAAGLEQDFALGGRDLHQRLEVPGHVGSCPGSLRQFETFGDPAVQAGFLGEVHLHEGGDSGGADRLGYLQTAGESRPPGLARALAEDQEQA
jgi:hypothetical protein